MLLRRCGRFFSAPRRRRVSGAALGRLERVAARYESLSEACGAGSGAPDVGAMRELAALGDVLAARDAWAAAAGEDASLAEVEAELRDARGACDAELWAEAVAERAALAPALAAAARRLDAALLPREPSDAAAGCLVEVESAAGGDEAAVFAGELLGMYDAYARSRGWRVEVAGVTRAAGGGVSRAYLDVTGDGSYAALKFESGVHRVQRVPKNDVRIHTSTAKVIVLPGGAGAGAGGDPAPLDPADVRVDTFRASGAGGQHVNCTDSAVRVTHGPTNTVVAIQDERSQHRNKAKALALLAKRVAGAAAADAAAERSTARAGLAGTGERAERIRTYNAPHDRVTDHRCGATVPGVGRVLDGALLGDFVDALARMDEDARLAAAVAEDEGA